MIVVRMRVEGATARPTVATREGGDVAGSDARALAAIERRLLWIACNIVYHANARREGDGSKVGGHQASSASVVSIMAALYFRHLRANDRVSVKPHAAPVLHAVEYLLGHLDRRHLSTLRAYRGLQAYPSRTKDPFRVDFSTGSVGLGAVAPLFAALTHEYAERHFGHVTSRRFFALIGDAELDEGNVWEALLENVTRGLGNVTWIVDLNRQSLDRVVPGIKVRELRRHFEACGWNVIDVKYGSALEAAFRRKGGEVLRSCIDAMSNEAFQQVLRMTASDAAGAVLAAVPERSADAVRTILTDGDPRSLLASLGGHDVVALLRAFAAAERICDRPTVIFAYTIKGWGLPFAGDASNHSRLMSPEEMAELRAALAIPQDDEWARFPSGSLEGRVVEAARKRLRAPSRPAPTLDRSDIPTDLDIQAAGVLSTQQTFGRLLVQLAKAPGVAERIVTAAPDVASSTNLSGWVLKRGLYDPTARGDATPAAAPGTWRASEHGQHIELGISETNLLMVLGAFGLANDHVGQQILPIGAVYDPFIARGLDAFIYGLYSGSRFILVGTPSGVTLSPEGGAHQSTITLSLGQELPELDAYEPCYARELEWVFLESLRQCSDPRHGRSTYLRLSTKPIDQGAFDRALERIGREELERQVLAGGYRLVDWRDGGAIRSRSSLVHVVATGAMVPEAVAAAEVLHTSGVAANVINVTSARLLFESWREHHDGRERFGPFDWLIPPSEGSAPIVTIADASSHALAWMGSVHGARVYPLGVDAFGQSGTRHELYRHYGIDRDAIVSAARRIVHA